MERLVQVNRDQLSVGLHQELEQVLAKVMDAVNSAKDARLIEDGESPVFHLMKELETRVFQRALQLRVDVQHHDPKAQAAGMRWNADNAQAMMALETLQQCDAWNAWRKMRLSSVN